MDMDEGLEDEVLQELYTWVDEIPLTRPKRNMTRDFSDGVMAAELIKHFFPKLVEVHNYTPANATKKKEENWYQLNRKVLKKLNIELSEDVIRSVATCKQWTVERVLLIIRSKIDKILLDERSRRDNRGQYSDRTEADQGMHQDSHRGAQHQSKISPSTKSQLPPRALGTSSKPNGKDNPVPDPKPSSNNIPGQKSLDDLSTVGDFNGKYYDDQYAANITKAQAQSYTSDVVPRLAFEEKSQECLAKEETINILQAKIRRLEHLLHLKDLRINDLTGRLEQIRPTNQLSPTAVRKKPSQYN